MNSEEFGNAEAYFEAFSTLLREGIHDNHLALLRAHYAAPEHTTTWETLAKAVGYARGAAVNMQYGTLAKRVAVELGVQRAPHQFWLFVLVDWAAGLDEESGHTRFVLRRPVIEALQRLVILPAVSRKQGLDPGPILHRLIPDENWSDVMEALATSIDRVHRANAATWGLGLTSRDLVLAIGPHPVLRIGPWELPFQLIFESESAPNTIAEDLDVAFSEVRDRYGKETSVGYYPSSPGSEACGMALGSVREAYALLLPSHAAIIAQAAKGPMDPDIPHIHSAAVVEFVAREVGHKLPHPNHVAE